MSDDNTYLERMEQRWREVQKKRREKLEAPSQENLPPENPTLMPSELHALYLIFGAVDGGFDQDNTIAGIGARMHKWTWEYLDEADAGFDQDRTSPTMMTRELYFYERDAVAAIEKIFDAARASVGFDQSQDRTTREELSTSLRRTRLQLMHVLGWLALHFAEEDGNGEG